MYLNTDNELTASHRERELKWKTREVSHSYRRFTPNYVTAGSRVEMLYILSTYFVIKDEYVVQYRVGTR